MTVMPLAGPVCTSLVRVAQGLPFIRVIPWLKSYIRYNSVIRNGVLPDAMASPAAPSPPPEARPPHHLFPLMAATPIAKQVFIQGVTRSGRTFRPSDWAERLAGVMSQFRPGGSQARMGHHISYSPWCVPTVMNGVKVVVVHTDLREAEPMAWDFVMNFAKDNDLQVVEACLMPDAKG